MRIPVISARYRDDSGRTIEIEHDSGTFFNPSKGHILSITDLNGDTTEYTYNSSGLLTEIISPWSLETDYTYTKAGGIGPWRAASIIQGKYGNGSVMDTVKIESLSYTYPEFTLDINAENGTSFTYFDATGSVSNYTDPSGINISSENDYYGYAVNYSGGNGNIHKVLYDGYGNPIKIINPDGTSRDMKWFVIKEGIREIPVLKKSVNEVGATVKHYYDSKGNEIRTVDALKGESIRWYDSLGRLVKTRDARGAETSYSYDAKDNLIKTVDALGGTSQYSYDAIGRKISYTDPNGNTYTYGYDNESRLIYTKDPYGLEERKWYDSMGNLIKLRDKRGYNHTYAYDIWGRKISETDALGNTITYEYDNLGRMIARTDARGYTTQYEYDASGRLIKETDPMGNSTTYEYDNNGNMIAKTDALGHTWRKGYDSRNRVIWEEDPLGHRTTYEYDGAGNMIASTDAMGNTWHYYYDIFGRKIAESDPMGDTVHYSYDLQGNVIAVTDANNHTWHYYYDLLGRKIREMTPTGAEWRFTYDANGNMITRTDPNGAVTTYQYCKLNRVINTSYPDGSYVEYSYNACYCKPTGMRYHAPNGTYSITKVLDALDRPVSVTRDYGAFSKTVNYTYDANGNVVEVSIPSEDRTISYTYDGDNRVVTISDSVNGILGDTVRYIYDANGRVVKKMLGDTPRVPGPVISHVHASNISSFSARISCVADSIAKIKVYYGTDPNNLGNSTEFSEIYSTNPSIVLIGLSEDTIYYYDVEVMDEYGHRSYDNLGGSHYVFRTAERGDILIVLSNNSGYDWKYLLKAYNSSLGDNGWTYDWWYVWKQGNPPLSEMKEYKAVIWQVGIDKYISGTTPYVVSGSDSGGKTNRTPFTDSQRVLIKDYLDDGGRLWVISNDLAFDLGNSESPYYNSTWLKSVLKESWKNRPEDISKIEGISGDAISGDYTGGINYDEWGSWLAGDEVSSESSGGTTTYVWTDTNDNCAVKWVSSANNGTAGDGVWGGTPSRLVVYNFEWSAIDSRSDVNSATRDDILQKTLSWLLDDEPPVVTVTNPSEGDTITSSSIHITWTRNTYGDSGIYQTKIYYSENGGDAWHLITTLGDVTSYDWDISSIPNGNNYIIKIVVIDNSSVHLRGYDTSGVFIINQLGGDTQGPVVKPGTDRAEPISAIYGQMIWFNATVDDSNKGNSSIYAAEFFVDSIGADGTGTEMSPVDGIFDSPIENLTWSGTCDFSRGAHILYVHAEDSAGNWGPFTSIKFVVGAGGEIRYEYDDAGRMTRMQYLTVKEAIEGMFDDSSNSILKISEETSGETADSPYVPQDPWPYDNAHSVRINPTLSVYVSDPNGDNLTVSFYDASNDNLLGTISDVPSGSRVSIHLSNLATSSNYAWYVTVSDGEHTTTSPTWTFRTLNVSMDLRYTYDADNRIIEKYEQSWMTNYQPEVTYYQYDPAGRLTEVQYPWGITESYQYDPAGNRISLTNSETGTTYYTYDEENKLLYTNHSGNLTYYDYDKSGNMISVTSPNGNTTYYAYDYERRLISVTLPNNINITYAYLPNGDRIMRQNSTSTIYYLYDREDRIGDYDANGNLIQSYTHGPGIDEPVAMAANGNTYFYIPDIQGSIRAIVDTQGNAVATYQYDAWGNLVSYGGPMAEKNDYLYTSREYDWQTGIYYYRARYYNPELGRFLSQDPAGMVDGPNMYVYVKNNPVNEVDPKGEFPIVALFAAAIIAAVGWCTYNIWNYARTVSLPSGVTQPDKYRHCYASCRTNRECFWYISPQTVAAIGVMKEIWDFKGGHPEWGDLNADITGISKSYEGRWEWRSWGWWWCPWCGFWTWVPKPCEKACNEVY